MKGAAVDSITSNEMHIRSRIFDGDLQISGAAEELLRIEKAQHEHTRDLLADARAELAKLRARS